MESLISDLFTDPKWRPKWVISKLKCHWKHRVCLYNRWNILNPRKRPSAAILTKIVKFRSIFDDFWVRLGQMSWNVISKGKGNWDHSQNRSRLLLIQGIHLQPPFLTKIVNFRSISGLKMEAEGPTKVIIG